MGGTIRGHGAPRRRSLRAKEITGRSRVTPWHRTFGSWSMDRPKPDRWPATWRPVLGLGNDRGRTLGRGRTIGVDGRNRRSGTRCQGRRSRSCVRPKPDGEPGSPCLGADEVGKHQPPMRLVRLCSPEGEVGRGSPTDASHDGTPEGGPAVQGPMRRPLPTEAGVGRSRRTKHGSGDTRSRGAVRAQSPFGSGGTSSRASACHPVQQPNPRPERARGRSQAHPVHESGERRTGTRGTAGNTEAFLADIAFYPTLHIGSIGGYSPPATATPDTALAPIYNLCSAFHVETSGAATER